MKSIKIIASCCLYHWLCDCLVYMILPILDEYKRKRKSCVFFKVDYEKTYDSVSWEFIYYMLWRLRFCDRWIRWIKGCLESASVSVLVNDNPTKEFLPMKGLRQDDPLAPFFFLIVAEEIGWGVKDG